MANFKHISIDGTSYDAVPAGSYVTGVKGSAESAYRTGNVNLSKTNVGLGNVPNVTTNNQTPTFSQASTRDNVASGDKLSVLFSKIMKWFADLKTVAFTGSYNDLSDLPTRVTGVKGNSESSYRTGNVNITKSNIGLGSVPNVSTNNQTPTFTQANTRANIASGETLSVIMGKIMKFFADLKAVAFSGTYASLTSRPTVKSVTKTVTLAAGTYTAVTIPHSEGTNNLLIAGITTSGSASAFPWSWAFDANKFYINLTNTTNAAISNYLIIIYYYVL